MYHPARTWRGTGFDTEIKAIGRDQRSQQPCQEERQGFKGIQENESGEVGSKGVRSRYTTGHGEARSSLNVLMQVRELEKPILALQS